MKRSLIITPRFNIKNLLEIRIQNNTKNDFVFLKVCFSLIYSIKSLKGAKILKQVGRYYELGGNKFNLLANTSKVIIIKLQKNKISSYNMSCGPEGLFILDRNNILLKSYINKLTFKNKLPATSYKKNFLLNKIPILPQPNFVNFNGKFVYCDKNFFTKSKKLESIISILKKTCRLLKINFNSKKGLKIVHKDKTLNHEEYIIDISTKSITIFSSDYAGRLYALISLIHLMSFYNKKLPIGKIKDKPRFSWRGMHLDCARQYYSIKKIKRLLNYMALFKLNRFHWHLTDNEAWRLEIMSFPNIAKKSSYRGYNQIIPPLYGTGYRKNGGYYKKEDVYKITQHAKQLNIEVMPEIDLPSHSWALVQVMPEIANYTFKKRFKDNGNYKNNTINPSLNITWRFLEKVFKDVSRIFPFNLIHIGVDERPKNSWKGDFLIKSFMKKNDINNEEKLQDYFVNRIIKILKKHNKKTGVWNDAALLIDSKYKVNNKREINKDCFVFAWQGPKAVKLSLKKGFKTIICQGQTCYLDMAYNNSTQERGLCWAGTTETKDIHQWEPLKNIQKKYHSLILGLQGHLWSETINKDSYFDLMINPRLAAIAEVAWSSNNRRKWQDFRSTLFEAIKVTQKLGWKNHEF